MKPATAMSPARWILLSTALGVWFAISGPVVSQQLPYPATATPEPVPLELLPPNGAGSAEVLPIPAEESVAAPEGIAAGEELLGEETLAPPVPWYSPQYWIGPVEWDSAVELGINGSSGTSESISVRAGGYIKHESDLRKVAFDIYHNRTNASGVETQNNARTNFRHDWLFGDSPWTIYAMSQLYYDEFQAFDVNVNVNSGLGYRFLDYETIELTGSFGSGASRKFGGSDDQWIPEAQFGLEYEQKISKRQKLTAKTDYFPEWGNFSNFRLITDVGWEVALDAPSNVSLKVAATDRYDGQPDGAPPHNLNYSVLLLWKL